MKRLVLKLFLLSIMAFAYSAAQDSPQQLGPSCSGGGATCFCGSGQTCTATDGGCSCS